MEARYCLRCGAALVDRPEEGRVRRACPACGWTFYDNPVPVVAALLEHRGEIVLVRNHGWPESWHGLVSGFLERDERPEDGVLRELKEELGLDGRVVSFIGAYPFALKNELILAWHVQAEGEIALGAEIASVKRVPPDRLRAWPLGTGLAVADWLRRRSAG